MANFNKAFSILMGKPKKKESKIDSINRKTRARMSAEESSKRERIKKALRGSD
jgi:hypothetical protein